MRSLKLFIAQQRGTFVSNVPVGLRRHNPKLCSEIDSLKLLFQPLDAFENDREAFAEAGKVGVELIFRNAGGSAVFLPNRRHGQFEYVFDARASDDRTLIRPGIGSALPVSKPVGSAQPPRARLAASASSAALSFFFAPTHTSEVRKVTVHRLSQQIACHDRPRSAAIALGHSI
jgi:hypothetical protein